jgi:hypothetical protein
MKYLFCLEPTTLKTQNNISTTVRQHRTHEIPMNLQKICSVKGHISALENGLIQNVLQWETGVK